MNLIEVKEELEAVFRTILSDDVEVVEVDHRYELNGNVTLCYVRGFVPDDEDYSDEQILDLYLRPMVGSFAQECNRMKRDGFVVNYLRPKVEEDTDTILLDTEPALKVCVEWQKDVDVDDDKVPGLIFSVETDIGDVYS